MLNYYKQTYSPIIVTESKAWYHLKWGLSHIPPSLIQFRQEQKGLKHHPSKQQLFGGFARWTWIMQHRSWGGQCKIERGWAAGRCPHSAPSPSAEILKRYNNEAVSPRMNLREHSACSPMNWNLSSSTTESRLTPGYRQRQRNKLLNCRWSLPEEITKRENCLSQKANSSSQYSSDEKWWTDSSRGPAPLSPVHTRDHCTHSQHIFHQS